MQRDNLDVGNLSLLQRMGNPFEEENTLTLMDLPREILVKVVEQSTISLEDRMQLRRTCREMMEVVGRSDYVRESMGFIKDRDETGAIIISGLIKNKTRIPSYPATRSISFRNLMRKLFRNAHFGRMRVNFLNFRYNDSFGLDILIDLSKSIVCNTLIMFFDMWTYEASMIEFLGHIKVRSALQLHMHNVSEEIPPFLLDLPPVKTLIISSDAHDLMMLMIETGHHYVPDTTLFTLIEKHARISLTKSSHMLTSRRLLDARKLISDCRHTLEVDISYDIVEEVHEALGVKWNEQYLMSTDENVHITATVSGTRRHYSIKVDRTTVSFGFDYVSDATFDKNQTVRLLIEPCDESVE